MLRISLSLCLMAFTAFQGVAQDLKSAADFLGYDLGQQFTAHHRVVDYVQHVGENSDWAKFEQYGQTYERRDLVVLYLSSPENLAALEQRRMNNLIHTGLAEGNADGPQVPVIWLNFNIHGDEASATEAGMATIEALTDPNNKQAQEWLKNTIVIIDPCVNPDGRDRYVGWYNQEKNANPNADMNAQEHHHEWASGRQNHYLIDLNRDWAWQTQIESQQRLALYKKWMPHVHCDFHEMGVDEDYFFAPAARPMHEDITSWQRSFQEYVGQNHASHFDRKGWLYFTQSDYDLFYPSYGDTWPIFNGALGFTYEQGGSRRAGVKATRDNGDILTLTDRVAHHKTVALSTIEISVEHSERIIAEYNRYFGPDQVESVYKSYVIKNKGNERTVEAMRKYLDTQQIRYSTVGGEKSGKGFAYKTGEEASFKVEKNDLIISSDQPLSHLVKVLFEPTSVLEDSMTYDATAWSLPYIFNVEAYASKSAIAGGEKIDVTERPLHFSTISYAWLANWNDVTDVQYLSALLVEEIKVRHLTGKVLMGGKRFLPGSLVVLRDDNKHLSDDEFLKRFNRAHKKARQEVTAVETGMTPGGQDLGHYSVKYIDPPKVALISGRGVSSTHFGELWFYFDQELDYPVTVLRTDYLARVDLSEYDVIIVPDGWYGKESKTLLNYAGEGGKLILMGSAVGSFMSTSDDGPSTALAKAKKKGNNSTDEHEDPPKYGGSGRRHLSHSSAGSIYKVELDASHPLGYGAGDSYYIMKTNDDVLPYIPAGSGWNIGRIKDDGYIAGFAGHKLQEKLKNSMALGIENYSGGTIIYFSDTPVFRNFWHGGKIILGNAVFLAN